MSRKNIVVIEGSPKRNGTTDRISNQFIKGAQEQGHEVEKIYLNGKSIKGCQGCEVCKSNGGECIFKDDSIEIVEKIIAADIFVFVSPVYFYSITSQLKTLIDRTYARDKEIKNKTAYFIMSSAAPYEAPYEKFLNTALGTFRGYLECLENVEEGGIVMGTGMAFCDEIENHDAFKQAYEMGKSIK